MFCAGALYQVAQQWAEQFGFAWTREGGTKKPSEESWHLSPVLTHELECPGIKSVKGILD